MHAVGVFLYIIGILTFIIFCVLLCSTFANISIEKKDKSLQNLALRENEIASKTVEFGERGYCRLYVYNALGNQGSDYDFKIFDEMAQPAFIFDGRNLLDHAALYELGFNVYPLGRRALSHLE